MNVKDLIRSKRIQKGLTMKELAEKVGVSEATISRWESGEIANMKRSSLMALAKALSIAPSSLIDSSDHSVKSQGSATSDLKLTPVTDYVNIPVFGAIACGEPIEAFNEVLDYTTIPALWLKGGQEYFCLTAAGDSMEPLISEGDIAVIRKQPDCENGQICAVFVNGYDATLKKVYKTGRIITLQPVNPAREPQSFEIGGDTDIQIIGVMVELRKRFA